MSVHAAAASAAIQGEHLSPQITTSSKYKHWVSIEDYKRCFVCASYHGKIWLIAEDPIPKPRLHGFCRCKIQLMEAIIAGTATIKGVYGADWKLKYEGVLPEYYVTKQDLKLLSWKKGRAVSDYANGKILTKGVYHNANGHLPQTLGRVWYEADINYKTGPRNSQRILWSNDGRIFVTYDHYETFYEIV